MRLRLASVLALVLGLAGLAAGPVMAAPDCGDAGLQLPPGFCATVFADELGSARHLAITADGRVYVALRQPRDGGGIVALVDTNGDGVADKKANFGEAGGTGIAIYDGYLYLGTVTEVLRYPLPAQGLVPEAGPQVVVTGMPEQTQHRARSLVINDKGDLFVNIGAPSNACQEADRQRRSPGQDPCPLLQRHGGIWRFDADELNQQFTPQARFATGIRNAVAMDWYGAVDALYILQHGRDSLHRLWPELYTEKQSANLPAEEFFKVEQGDNFGWPYCYYDPCQDKKVLAPEYGGDGDKVGRCAEFEDPILAFPAHWAPNGLLFYNAQGEGDSEGFPDKYSGGAFIAFHGSWNRAPLPQQGYKVVFVPFEGGLPATGEWREFASGFAGQWPLSSPGQAEYRPVGLARGPGGALYVTDDAQGRIWRISHP